MQPSPHPSPAGLSFQARHSATPGPGPAGSPSVAEISSTDNAAGRNQQGFSQRGNVAHGSSAAAYRAGPRTSSQDFHSSYTLSPTLSIVNPAQSSSMSGSYHGGLMDYQPRTEPPPIYVVTQGLQLPSLQHAEVPGLRDSSPWPSSASDSTYSTPVSDVSRNQRPWASSQRLSPYPNTTPRGLQSSGPGIEGLPTLQPPLFANSYQNPEHSFGGTLNVPSSLGYSVAGASHHHSSLSASSNGTIRPHQHRHSFSSARGRTPPLTSSHGAETLLSSAPSLSNQLDSMSSLDRRKEVLMEAHQNLLGSHTSMDALDVLGDLSMGYGGSTAVSPGADNSSHSSGIVAELDLALGGGCAMPNSTSMSIPLPGPVRAAIPRYLELYWTQVHTVLPLIHRPSFDAAPEDVLRCAMAAVATQHLDNKEDRTRGNQLHEFAWQEVKRVSDGWPQESATAVCVCVCIDQTAIPDSPMEPTNDAGHSPVRVFRTLPRPQGCHTTFEAVRVSVFEGESTIL